MSDAEKQEREETENKARRIERWHRTGQVFLSLPDLGWLYIELALANGGIIDWNDEDRLKKFVEKPIWDSLVNKNGNNVDALLEQSGIFVENTKFHSTALRDYFLREFFCKIRTAIEERLENPAFVSKNRGEARRKQKNKLIWRLIIGAAIVGIGWYSFWVGLVLATIYGLKLFIDAKKHREFVCQHVIVNSIIGAISKGGFDEPDVIRSLDVLKEKYNCEFVPSVLYALLRLPRRNVEHDVIKIYQPLGENKKKELWDKWNKFVGEMLNNDDGEAAKKAWDNLENIRAVIFKPISDALDNLSENFEGDVNIVFTSKDRVAYKYKHGIDFPSTYSIDINEDGGQKYHVYTRCDKNTTEDDFYSIVTCVTKNPSVFSEFLFFFKDNEAAVVPTIKAILLYYQKQHDLTENDIKRIQEDIKKEYSEVSEAKVA